MPTEQVKLYVGGAVARLVEGTCPASPVERRRRRRLVKLGVGSEVEYSMIVYCLRCDAEAHFSRKNSY